MLPTKPVLQKRRWCLITRHSILCFLICIVFLWLPAYQTRAQTANNSTDLTSRGSTKENSFKLPARKTEAHSPTKNGDIKAIFGETGIKVGIVIGIFAIAVLLLAKRKDRSTIPSEAIEILGSVPMSPRQSVQLIRFGQKLVLVESASTGLKPISEITDPDEVDRMLAMIQTRAR